MRFLPGEEFQRDVWIPKMHIRAMDGSELTDDDSEDPGGWPPLAIDDLPAVDPFPVDVLPEPARRLVIDGADAIGCPPDFLGLPVLATAAGTIGRSVSLRLKPGYFTSTTLYAGNIGPPSDGKTPALKAVTAAVRAIDAQLAAEHAQGMEQWKQATAGLPKGTKPPPAPKPRRIDIDDATMEVLPLILAHNPRGLIMIRDELTAFLQGMNQYKSGKGNDRSNATKIWSGDRIVKDRVNHENGEPIRCAHPALSIIGGLTPDMLGEMVDRKGRADGFIDRFLLVYPDPMPVADWSDRGIPETVADGWRALIAGLWARPLDVKDGRPVPHVVYFDPCEGKDAWENHYNAHVAEMNAPDFPPHLRGPWGKLREYAGRLTLILALMHHAADPDADPNIVPEIGSKPVDDAWRLIAYLKSHVRRVHAVIATGPTTGKSRAVMAILDWIREGQRASFIESDLKQARRWLKGKDLADALKYMTGRHAIRIRQAAQSGPKGGRPLSPTYEVHPDLLGTVIEPPGGFQGFQGFQDGSEGETPN
jgi:hypothetical protein